MERGFEIWKVRRLKERGHLIFWNSIAQPFERLKKTQKQPRVKPRSSPALYCPLPRSADSSTIRLFSVSTSSVYCDITIPETLPGVGWADETSSHLLRSCSSRFSLRIPCPMEPTPGKRLVDENNSFAKVMEAPKNRLATNIPAQASGKYP